MYLFFLPHGSTASRNFDLVWSLIQTYRQMRDLCIVQIVKNLISALCFIMMEFFLTLYNVLEFIEKNFLFFIFSSFVSPWLYYTLCKSPLTLMNNEFVTYYGN